MPVNSTHPDYDVAAGGWSRARDVLAGEDAVKAGGEKYLPRIESQTDAEYAAYRQRAVFFNATARTAEGYIGLIFRRPPFVKIPEEVRKQSLASLTEIGNAREPITFRTQRAASLPPRRRALASFVNDADLLGTSLAAYSKEVVSEIIGVGRAGSLVDWEEDFEQRAYVSLYSAEQIINWRVERVNGRSVPTLVVLRETGVRSQEPGVGSQKTERDPFVEDTVEQIRVVRLVDSSLLSVEGAPLPTLSPSDGERVDAGRERGSQSRITNQQPRACVVEIWQPKATKSRNAKPEWQLVESRVPLRLGKALPLIPFVFHGPRHSRPDVDKPPLTDIIAVNLDHYRLDADFKHGLHFTALPTAWVSGFEKSATLRVGSSTAWVSETLGATAGFLEFKGEGLGSFERAMDRDERLMAVLGSRLLEDQKKVGETAQAIELRQSGENSILSSIAASASESLTQVLRWVYWWNSTEEVPDGIDRNQVLVRLNSDFSLQGMPSDELQAIVKAWQSGAISQSTMLELFRKGEILPDGRTNEEEVSLLRPSAARVKSETTDLGPQP